MKKEICIGIVDVSGLLGIVFQFVNIPNIFKIIITIVFSCATLYYSYIFFSEIKTYTREKRIKKVIKFIMNAKNKIVFFGGNLSWASDYIDCIKTKMNEGCSVDVYYDNNENMSTDAINSLNRNIKILEDSGCKVYKLNRCYSLRCIISDALNQSNNAKGIIIEKTNRNLDYTKNRYKIINIVFKGNDILSTLLFDITKMVEKNSEPIL